LELYKKLSTFKESRRMKNEYRENLLMLAIYLYNLPKNYEHFDMANFFRYEGEYYVPHYIYEKLIRTNKVRPQEFTCGTVACAVGHAPALSHIKPEFKLRLGEYWVDYTIRLFGDASKSPIFDWCFGGNWALLDNTPKGAAQRIKFYLHNEEKVKSLITQLITRMDNLYDPTIEFGFVDAEKFSDILGMYQHLKVSVNDTV
jgi:hypothetical protein